MKSIALYLTLFCLSIQLSAQSFTQVTTGDFVNDSSSLSTNWGDFNQDGWNDLFYTGNNGPRLHQNNGDGTFTSVGGGDLTLFGAGISGTWGDYNRDGFPDLFKSGPTSGTKLYQNNGDGTFTKIEMEPLLSDSADFQGNSWVDYDNDGHLDLFVTAGGNGVPMTNRLYHNLGDGTFESVSGGTIVTDEELSVDGALADYNNDGFVDIYVVNGIDSNLNGKNSLYKNNGDGTFTKIVAGEIVEDVLSSLGASWGDYDNDGDFDLFVTSTNEENALYRNDGNDNFTKISAGPVVTTMAFSIGSTWGDLDNDGFLDLFVVNIGENQLFINNSDGTFTQLFNDPLVTEDVPSFGTSLCDYDHDGDLDISISNISENNSFFMNNGNNNHWINIKCVGTISNPTAIGTKVKIKTIIDGQPVWQLRQIQGQTGVLGQNSLNVEFGLGNATTIDSLVIEWPSGIVFDTANVSVDQYITQVEHLPVGITTNFLPAGYEFYQNYPNPFATQTLLKYTLPQDSKVSLEVYDQKGVKITLEKELLQVAGTHTYLFDANELSPGIYYATFRVKGGAMTRKMIIVN